MAYLLFAALMATTIIGILVFRNRESSDPAKSVDAFERAIRALSPEREGEETET